MPNSKTAFVGSQIRKIVKDPQFEEKFNHIELSA
jgi:hypothetical protein